MGEILRVGLIGLGGMGRTHFSCYANNPAAKVVAICDVDERKRSGDWSAAGLNIDTGSAALVDLSDIRVYDDPAQIIADAEIDAIDICLPTPEHARWSMAALSAGKHVMCEKPMAMDAAECEAVRSVHGEAGKQMMVGHCLRFWPHYVKAYELIASGDYGMPLLARFHRAGDTPCWSWDDWLRDGKRSGGAVFDMHIHDADTALWWFGKPDEVVADGLIVDGLPLVVDAHWRYNNGPLVTLYGAWDNNGGDFSMAFKVVLEKASIEWDSSRGDDVLLIQDGKTTAIPVDGGLAYQYEIDEFIQCALQGVPSQTITLPGSQDSVEIVREELRQIEAKQ